MGPQEGTQPPHRARRLLWISDSPALATGFGTVGRQVLARLSEDLGYEVECLGWHHAEPPSGAPRLPYPTWPQEQDGAGAAGLLERLSPDGGDVLITVGDPWRFAWVAPLRAQHSFTWIAYLTVCSRPLPPQVVGYLREADAVAVASEFGVEVFREALPDLPVEMIPYGVDARVFRPLPERDELRARNGLAGRFVVGFVGRNQPRKQIPVLVKAFSRLQQTQPDVFLYLHTDANDAGWDVPGLLARYGLADHSGVTANFGVYRGLPDATVNEIYNLFDVFVLPSMGEGFGLPLLEAMSAGVPVITTDYSSNRELVAGRGELIGIRAFLTATLLNFELPLPDEEDLARKLERAYREPDRRTQHREAALEYSRALTWGRCAASLHELIARCTGRDREG